MLKNSKTQTIIKELCQKLHCSELAEDLDRVDQARGLLTHMHQNEILKKLHPKSENINMSRHEFRASLKVSDVLLETKQRLNSVPLEFISSDETRSEDSIHTKDNLNTSKEDYETENSFECEDLLDDSWLGFFRGYEILKENQECFLSEYKQCMEISLTDDIVSLEGYLRAGIRCFMIDLFLGTELEKQKLVFHLRESELKLSKEYGFPISTTLFALLSPRLQYTGAMDVENSPEKLSIGDNIILSTKRKESTSCTSYKIYVNARFLLEDCKKGDFILVGPSIQLAVTEVLKEELKCVVVEPGLISSRLPVRFPAQCFRSQVSLEELEDITFAREVGINVLVSYKPGSRQYLKELYETFDLLKYENVRIFTRLVLNEYENEDFRDIEWIAESYEGFLVEPNSLQFNNSCQADGKSSLKEIDFLKLYPACANLMTKLYNLKKPIILRPSLIAERLLLVLPQNFEHIFQCPDKFLFSKNNLNNVFFFNFLQKALTKDMPSIELDSQRFCDPSEVGDDTMARACVAASFETQAQAIVICSAWPDMAIKVSHFRPKVPIILVSATKSLSNFISLYHHLIFLHFPWRCERHYAEYLADAFILSLIYLKTQKILRDDQKVLLVYATNAATQLCDKYLLYKFKENSFASNLKYVLFT